MSKRNPVRHHGGPVGTNKDGTRLYASVPMELARDGKLTAAARSIAVYIWSHDAKFGQSRNDVADKLGMSVNTVGKALGDLQAHGWLVREILGRGAEVWHLQMSNTPFTPDQILTLSGATGSETDLVPNTELDQKLIQSDGTGSETDPHTGSETDLVTGSKTDLRSSASRSAPRSALRSSSEDPFETGLESRSLSIAVSEATDRTAARQPAKPRQAASASEDPFASEPVRVAEYQPASAGGDWSQREPGDDRDRSLKAEAFRAHKPFWND